MSGGLAQDVTLPESWGSHPIKRVADVRTSNVDKKITEGEQRVRLCNYTDVYYSDSVDDPQDFMVASATSSEIERFRLLDGDVLITKDSESRDDIAVPAFVPREFQDVLCGYHLALVRPKAGELDGRFLFYTYETPAIADQYSVAANGITRFGLSQHALRNAAIPVPPLPTQRAIASFLDRETEKIDTLIEKKQRLIELMEEKLGALITRAVTRGLDPDVPMKDSGVEWLGEIPEHWEVRKLKSVARAWPSNVDKQSNSNEQPVKLCNYTDVYYGDRIDSADEFMTATASPTEIRRFRVEPGDVLVTKDSETPDDIAVPAYIEESWDHVLCGYHLFMIRSDRRLLDGRYLHYGFLCQRISDQLSVAATGITRYGLSIGDVENAWLPLPPLEEQREIALELDGFGTRVQDLRSRVREAISLLQEYRTALISAAVTGQIDVSDKAPT